MSHVVTSVCLGCKCGICVDSCPVDAFHETDEMLLIDPEVCVDCEACVSVCTRNAIMDEKKLPESLSHWKEINKEADKFPSIRESQPHGTFPDWKLKGL